MLNISLQNLSWLEEKEKEVVSALRYFKTIVDKMAIDKKVLEMLPGSASKVLEAILPLVQSDPRIQHSSAHSHSLPLRSSPRHWGTPWCCCDKQSIHFLLSFTGLSGIKKEQQIQTTAYTPLCRVQGKIVL